LKPRIVRKILLLFLVSSLVLATVKTASSQQTSRNWAGYVINSNGITAISASWTVPKIQCQSTGSKEIVSQAVSVWIGIDGLGTAIPEQVGTYGLCAYGSPRYFAWEEDPSLASPGAQIVFPEIYYGEHITASIAYLGKNQFRLSIADAQEGDNRTFTVIISNTARASAEWIVEDPWDTKTGNYISLPTFQPVTFSDCSAAVNNVAGSILQNQASSWSMTDSNGNIIVTPQGLNQTGTSFEVGTTPVPEFPTTPLPILIVSLMFVLAALRTSAKAKIPKIFPFSDRTR